MSDTGQQANVSTTSAHVLYTMHALAPFTLWTLALLAVIIGAIARDNVRGTWVETHYSWLARTFGWGILWLIAITFTPSSPLPLRVTRPLISTPGSSVTASGFVDAFTCCPRSVFAETYRIAPRPC